jgi:hypothetical protein
MFLYRGILGHWGCLISRYLIKSTRQQWLCFVFFHHEAPEAISS